MVIRRHKQGRGFWTIVLIGSVALTSCTRGGFRVSGDGAALDGAELDGGGSADARSPAADGAPAVGDGPATDGDAGALQPWPGCVADVAVSTLTTCVLFRDGHVECVGHNTYGQLGDGTTNGRRELQPVKELTEVVRLDAAAWGYCAVRGDATAWCWGQTTAGRFGAAPPDPLTAPTKVPGLAGVRAFKAGSTHGCALRADGHVACLGGNEQGQLGGPAAPDGSPTEVALGQQVHALASCWGGSAAVLADGTVASWGFTGSSQSDTPVALAIDNVTAISAHAPTFVALRGDGSVWAWGRNNSGQLGDGETSHRADPAPVIGITGAVSVAGGGTHACAALADGEVRCWGENGDRLKLGVEELEGSGEPVKVSGLPPAIVVRAGQEHSCAIVDSGEVWCWGHNSSGQLGRGSATVGELPGELLVECP